MKRLTRGLVIALSLLLLGVTPISYAQNVLQVSNATTTPGSPVTVRILLSHDQPTQGFQTAVTYDNTVLTLIDMDTTGLDLEALLAPETVEFFLTTFDSNVALNTGWGAVAAIFDSSTPFNGQILPVGTQQSIINYRFTSVNNALLIGTSTPVNLTNGFGPAPGIENLITVNSSSVHPSLISGQINFVDMPTFIRGDTNSDGLINVADGIFLVQYLFINGTLPFCFDAADANDDSGLDVSDFIYLIFYQFMDGPSPQAPFPGCGIDTTEDGLFCDGYPSC